MDDEIAVGRNSGAGLSGDEAERLAAEVAALAQRAAREESGAFTRLVEIYWGDIYRMIYYRIRSQMDAEDLTQDVFVKAREKLSTLNDPGAFKSWLYRIAVNAVYDFARRRKLTRALGLSSADSAEEPYLDRPDDGPSPLEEASRQEFWARVGAYCDELPNAEREVFTLRFMDQLSLPEIAATLDKSESAVKTHLYRAVSKFRRKPGLLRVLRGE